MPRIHFIGAGNMAEAIAGGIIRAGLYTPADITATDPSDARRKLFSELGIKCRDDLHDLPTADVVVLATKPFVMADALSQAKAAGLAANALLVSIAAGISCAFLENAATPGARVVRVMPNTPMLAGKGMSAIAAGKNASDADMAAVERIFAAAGKVVRVPESAMDAVTGVSGSGPAYVFYLAELLAAAGTAAGLPKEHADILARQTVIGAAALLDQSPDSPEELRRKVTTPNGTTHAAIETFKAGDLGGLVTKAVATATNRSKELGK